MALQVWLPLDGDLRNQGLDGKVINISNTGATVNNNGKIGKCYNFDGVDDWARWNLNKHDYENKPITYCAWIKCGTTKASGSVLDIAADLVLSYKYNSSDSTIQFGYWRCYKNSSGNRTGRGNYNPNKYDATKWHHVALIFNKNINTFYVDGTFSTSFDDSAYYTNLWVPLLADSYQNFNIGKSQGDSAWSNILINDVRIYDHALSYKEVKELAKGLILHYPMNNKYLEETTNLITSEDALSNTCYNGATSKYGYGTNSDIHKIVTTFQGQKGTKVYMGTNGNNARPYSYINDMYVSDGTNKPAYKTLSFDYYTNIGTYISPYKLGSGNGTATWKVFNGVTTTGTYTNSGNIPIETNKWNHIEITFHGTTAANCEWGYIINGAQHVSNTNNFWFYANVQLEEKDHATGYIPYGTHRDKEIIELDCAPAGNQNDGTIVGTIIAAADSPRYETSYYFPSGANYINAGQGAKIIDAITVNMWIKYTTWGNPISCTEGGGWNFEESGGGIRFVVYTTDNAYRVAQSTVTSASLKDNKWHMFTGTYDGLVAKFYIDGIEKGTITGSTAHKDIKYNASNAIFIGAEASGNATTPASTTFVGNISDVRVYCTALSLSDIAELYQTAAQIDKDGNVYAYEFKEA